MELYRASILIHTESPSIPLGLCLHFKSKIELSTIFINRITCLREPALREPSSLITTAAGDAVYPRVGS